MGMFERVLEIAIGTGLMAALFVTLLVYVLRDARAREKKYQDTISKLHNQIHKDVIEIKTTIKKETSK